MAYTDEQKAEYIRSALLMLSRGSSVIKAAAKLGIPDTTLNDWLLHESNVGDYARARFIRADKSMAEIRQHRRQMLRGELPPEVARVAIQSLQWEASKLDKERYGDKQTTEITGKDGGPIKLDVQKMTDAELQAIIAAETK